MNAEIPVNYLLHRYERLVEIARDLASTLQLDVLLDRIIQAAVEISVSQAASLLLYDETTRQLYFQIATNMEDSTIRGLTVPVASSIAGWTIANRQPVIVADVHHDSRFFDRVEKTTHLRTDSLIAVPLINNSRVLGVLEVINRQTGEYSDEDLTMLEVLAAQAAVAIQNTRLFQQSDLISELIHEIRTPLASLTTASYLLEHPGISEQQRAELAGMIHSETQRLNDLATSFLDLARLESGRVGYQVSTIDVNTLVEECTSLVRPKAAESSITVEVNSPSEVPHLEADLGKIKQVLLNLLTNAVKYNRPSGKVTVNVRTAPGEVSIEVRDTGLGIPADALPHLGEKFYRVKGVEKVIPGTGLGLSISKTIIESHRGRLEIQSKEGEGSSFTIHLPVRTTQG